MWSALIWLFIGAIGGICFYNSERTDWYTRYKEDLPKSLKPYALILSIILTLCGPIGALMSTIIASGKYTFFYKGKY